MSNQQSADIIARIEEVKKELEEKIEENLETINIATSHIADILDVQVDPNDADERFSKRLNDIEERVTELEADDTASEATVENNPQSQTTNNNDDDDDDFDDDFYGPPANRRVVPQTPPGRQQLKY